MRIITIIPVVILLLENPLQAVTVLNCLGREELKIHIENDYQYNYKLNQELVNILSSGNGLNFSKREILDICESKQPSVTLLHKLLILSLDRNKTTVNSNVKKYFVDVVKSQVRPIFFRYISALQSVSPNVSCLQKKIPSIKIIQNRYRYLQEEKTAVKLITKKEIDKIFLQLIHINNYFLECMREV